jgi:hypothetical protein
MRYFVFLMSIILIGCESTPVREHDIIQEPPKCYPTPTKPKLKTVHFELQKLKSDEWAITIDDTNFDKILFNHAIIDNYIKKSYNTLMRYEKQCK